ncbi:MAG: CPBP family intramembrane metalloprotease [Alphaproteobacteria bacterium]|nr:CPBP family intramembrane metalloprotease [Alphaproteobacteria bacterium]MBP7757674.1 CPBP family intramembrane metalloprotease [Alphaproteobacteria bacterium]MBP7761126.1 CPBP family intramembrane metalloprotease [Alphaproteobacteria bacterium]MBP7904773.1 CPBP family intramembrane metalloprotease [Alphaproteobacteria bacterium]
MQENATTYPPALSANAPEEADILKSKLLLVFEFSVICLLIPTVIIAFRLARNMFLFLWGVTFFCWAVLFLTREGFWEKVWRFEAVNWQNMKTILPRWALCSIGMLIFIYFYDPARMFYIIEQRPAAIPVILFAYPLLSALPQEMIFCGYFFERFKTLFTTERMMIIASALVFAYAHVLYINWVAPLLSLVAGLIFASTYSKTKSLALVTIEHGLYGISLFLIGLGWYFYGGAVH